MIPIQVHFTDPTGITLYYKHEESNKAYGLKITYKMLQGCNSESLYSWINKAKTAIARQVYHVHDVILEDFKPSLFEQSKLSPKEYIKKCQKEEEELFEKQKARRKRQWFLSDLDSMVSDMSLGIRST